MSPPSPIPGEDAFGVSSELSISTDVPLTQTLTVTRTHTVTATATTQPLPSGMLASPPPSRPHSSPYHHHRVHSLTSTPLADVSPFSALSRATAISSPSLERGSAELGYSEDEFDSGEAHPAPSTHTLTPSHTLTYTHTQEEKGSGEYGSDVWEEEQPTPKKQSALSRESAVTVGSSVEEEELSVEDESEGQVSSGEVLSVEEED